MKRRLATRAIVIDENGKLFCVKQINYRTDPPHTNEYWCLPGGGIDTGEPMIPALEREMAEELGVQPVIGDLLYVQQFILAEKEYYEFFFHVLNFNDFQNINLSKTSHGVKEIAEFGFVENASAHLLPLFLKDENLSLIKPSGNSVKIFNNM